MNILKRMKEITLKIPEKKIDFYIELFKQLGIEISEEHEISEEQKNIVRERIKLSKPEELIPWSEAKKQLSFKIK